VSLEDGRAMSPTPRHLKALREIEKNSLSGLEELLHKEGLDAVRCVLWDFVGWQDDFSPHASRDRDAEERKRFAWEAAVRIERILVRVLHNAYERQTEETLDALVEGPEGFYR
jgi:hypothetical protein